MDLRRNIYVRQREWHQGPLMLADSEPQEYKTNHQTGSWLARPNKKGGSEMSKNPLCQEEWQCQSASLMQNTPTHQKRDSCCPWRGGFIPSIHKEEKTKLAKKLESISRAWGCAPQMKKGGTLDNPQGVTWSDLKNYPHKSWNAIDSIVNNKRLQ